MKLQNSYQKKIDFRACLFSFILGIILLGIPFIDDQSLIDPKLISRHLYLSVGLGVLSVSFLVLTFQKQQKYTFNPVYLLPFILLSLSYIIAVWNAHNLPESIFWASKITTFTVLFILLIYAKTYELIDIKIIGFFILLTVISSFILFFLEVENKDMLKTTTLVNKNVYNLSSPYGHKNLFSSFLVLCLPFLLILFKTRKLSVSILAGIVVISLIIMLFIVQTKSVLMGVLIGLILVIPIVLFKKSTPKRRVIIRVYALFSVVGLAALGLVTYSDYFTLLFQTDSFNERLMVWSNSIKIIENHFLMGVGGGNWQIFFPAYGLNDFYLVNNDIHLGYETFQRPHNDFLWVFGETGIVGFLAYCSIFIVGFIGLFQQIKNSISQSFKLFYLSCLVVMIAYTTVSFFDFPLERSEHQFLFILFLVICVPLKRLKHIKMSSKSKSIIISSVVFTITVISIAFTFLRYQEEQKHLKVLGAHKQGNWNKMIEHGSSVNQNIFSVDHFSIPVSWYLGVAHFSNGSLEEALQQFKRAYDVAPYQVHVINNLAGVYQKKGNQEKAMKYYDEALEIASNHYEVLLNKCIAHYKNNQLDESFSTLLKLRYKDEHPALYHRALRQVFNAKLDALQKDSVNYHHRSIENLQKSDSLKKVFLYEYQINHQPVDTLFNTFTMEI